MTLEQRNIKRSQAIHSLTLIGEYAIKMKEADEMEERIIWEGRMYREQARVQAIARELGECTS